MTLNGHALNAAEARLAAIRPDPGDERQVEILARAIYETADPAGGSPAWDSIPEWHLPHMFARARAVLAALAALDAEVTDR